MDQVGIKLTLLHGVAVGEGLGRDEASGGESHHGAGQSLGKHDEKSIIS